MNKFYVAMAAYAALALLAWLTLTAQVEIRGRPVPIVWIVWGLLGMFALRTWLHHERLKVEAFAGRERSGSPAPKP